MVGRYKQVSDIEIKYGASSREILLALLVQSDRDLEEYKELTTRLQQMYGHKVHYRHECPVWDWEEIDETKLEFNACTCYEVD